MRTPVRGKDNKDDSAAEWSEDKGFHSSDSVSLLRNCNYKIWTICLTTEMLSVETNPPPSPSPRGYVILGSLRIDDFRTTAPLGHLIVPRRRPVKIWISDSL